MMEKKVIYRSTVNPNLNKKRWLVNLISLILLLALIYVVFGASFSKDIFKTILGMNYRQFVSIFISILYTIILAVSLNLSTGCLGEMVLGHAGFMAVGAYAGSLFLKYSGAAADDNMATIIAILIGFVCWNYRLFSRNASFKVAWRLSSNHYFKFLVKLLVPLLKR